MLSFAVADADTSVVTASSTALERTYEDGLASRYFVLAGGQLRPVENFLKNLGIR